MALPRPMLAYRHVAGILNLCNNCRTELIPAFPATDVLGGC